jgi:hypothetical protein
MPDLSLHAPCIVQLGASLFRIYYDWKDDDQLLDWTHVTGMTVTRGDGMLTFSGGATGARTICWAKFGYSVNNIKFRQNNINTARANVYSGLPADWDEDWLPASGYGHVWRAPTDDPGWFDGGSHYSYTGTQILTNTWYTYEFEVMDNALRARVSVDGTWRSRSGTYSPIYNLRCGIGANSTPITLGTVILTVGRPT